LDNTRKGCRKSLYVATALLLTHWQFETFDPDSQKIDIRLKVDDGNMYSPETIEYFRMGMDNCRIFVTQDDEIGIAPHNAREGDVVCVVKGAFAPCILRQIAQDHWSLISGDCYLCNHYDLSRYRELYQDKEFTNSETFSFDDTQGMKEEDFIIC